MNFKIINGNSKEVLDTLEENSIDSCVTDPPYGLTALHKKWHKETSLGVSEGTQYGRLAKGFMGKEWDGTGIEHDVEFWAKVYRVLKPGGYLLAFGGTRTFHRIACAIEDAGFEIRDCIMWLYGCLSEDTEVLTKNGFKHFHKITKNDKIRIYDIEKKIYKWEKPERWSVYKVFKDTCFHIKSNSTDQIVSKNHRVYVERNGELIWEFAENLSKMERVPVLSYDIPFLQKSEGNILFSNLLWQNENLAKRLFCEWKGKEKSQEISLGRKKSCLERRIDLSQKKGCLCESKYKICNVSKRIYNNGEKRWICNGTSFESGTSNSKTFNESGGCSSYRSQCREQRFRKFNVVCKQYRSQKLRKWETYKTTLATIEPIEYTGIIFCPTVSTGCFVARRKGKVFITGNSGFPKSHNVGLDIDKLQGCPDRGHRIATASRFHPDGTFEPNGEQLEKYEGKTELGKKWQGFGTALKPAFEPIIMARKPLEDTVAKNCLKWGTGAINIDECRVETDDDLARENKTDKGMFGVGNNNNNAQICKELGVEYGGRFPANIITDGSDEVKENMPDTKSNYEEPNKNHTFKGNKDAFKWGFKMRSGSGFDDEGSACRYFYTAKASKKDRDEGLDMFEEGRATDGNIRTNNDTARMYGANSIIKKNIHPTVKPCELMQYLVRLVTPRGGVVLDPFNGSGSTGKAVAFENRERNADYSYIGIELDKEYCKISEARIDYAINKYEYDIKKEKEEKGELDLFDFIDEVNNTKK